MTPSTRFGFAWYHPLTQVGNVNVNASRACGTAPRGAKLSTSMRYLNEHEFRSSGRPAPNGPAKGIAGG